MQGVSFFRPLKSERKFSEKKNKIVIFFWGGGGRLHEGIQARVSQNWKLHGFKPLFFFLGGEELNFTFETKHTQISDFHQPGGSHQIIENMAEDDIFM